MNSYNSVCVTAQTVIKGGGGGGDRIVRSLISNSMCKPYGGHLTSSSFQGTRLDDQRSELPRPKPKEVAPDDAFFNQLMRVQSGRMEDQRANVSHNIRN